MNNILYKKIDGKVQITALITLGISIFIGLLVFVYDMTTGYLKEKDAELGNKIEVVQAKDIEQDEKISSVVNRVDKMDTIIDVRLKNIEEALGVPSYKIPKK